MSDKENDQLLNGSGQIGEVEADSKEGRRDGLERIHFWGYYVGHFSNDLCASMWFIYMSYFLLEVVGLDPGVAGLAILSGQITDGITTPIVGVLSDTISCKVGKRNAWYYFGTLLVIPSFLGIWTTMPFLQELSDSARNAWYITLPAIFNVGWASVQIAHLSIAAQLSYGQRRRDNLVNTRNGFTYIANIVILVFALTLFLFVSNQRLQFRVMAITAMAVGAVTSMFYVCTINEPKLSAQAIEYDNLYKKSRGLDLPREGEKKASKSPGDWMKEAQFYIFGMVYMFARIALNVNATMIPLYLTRVTMFEAKGELTTPWQLAVVPLCSYIASMLFSVFLQATITQKFKNRLIPLLMSAAVTTLGSLPFAFLSEDPSSRWLVYPLSFLQGLGIALMLNTGTSLINDVIGNDTKSAAFVYGAYSFFDKFANGILLYWLVAAYSDDGHALRYIIGLVPSISAASTAFFTWLGLKLYGDKLAKISKGSVLKKKTKKKKKSTTKNDSGSEDGDSSLVKA